MGTTGERPRRVDILATLNPADPTDHETHLAAARYYLPPFPFAERITWRDRVAHLFLRRPLPVTRGQIDAHIAAHLRMIEEVSGVHDLQRGPAPDA